jgi:predicted anti-sigma-YlaC factor YlaD
MARRRKTVKPRSPARVKKRKRAARTRRHQHPELIGLALAALGVFFATLIYLGWSGGFVGALAAVSCSVVASSWTCGRSGRAWSSSRLASS